VPFSMVGGVGTAAREQGVSGLTSSISQLSGSQILLYRYDNAYPGATNADFAFSFVFNT
jgi:hypothetical protein